MRNELIKMKELVDFELTVAKKSGVAPSMTNVEQYFGTITDHLNEMLEHDSGIVTVIKSKAITKNIKDIPYLTLAPVTIYKPRGCLVTLPVYGSAVHDLCVAIADVEKRLLTPFNQWVSKIIGTPALLSKLHDSKDFELLDTKAELAKVHKVANLDSVAAEGTYSNLLARNSDWVDAFDYNNKISKILGGRTIKDLEKSVSAVTANAKLLVSEVNTNPAYDVRTSVVDKLSNLIYSVGVEVELFGLAMTLATGYQEVLENNIERMRDVVK